MDLFHDLLSAHVDDRETMLDWMAERAICNSSPHWVGFVRLQGTCKTMHAALRHWVVRALTVHVSDTWELITVSAVSYLTIAKPVRDDVCVDNRAIALLIALSRQGLPTLRTMATEALCYLSTLWKYKNLLIRADCVRVFVHVLTSKEPWLQEAHKEVIAHALGSLVIEDVFEHQEVMRTSGAIDALLSLLQAGTFGQVLQSIRALRNMAFHSTNRLHIGTTGGVRAIVRILCVDTGAQKREATVTVRITPTSLSTPTFCPVLT